MTNDTKPFYITTAIDYPNSAPHMGHAYEKIVADFYARCARLRGLDTWFLIGLDEHGQKIQEVAERSGKSPQQFVDEKAIVFRDLYQLLEISHDDFIRTSEARHHRFATWLYERVRDKGDIYQGMYEADYCISCEKSLQKSDLIDGKCPIHDRPVTKIEEESYFFRLGKYRDAVREHIESHPDFVRPEERRTEVLSRLREEVHDLSISRSTFDWGVPLPDDPAHVLYVWFDALSNYVSALREPQQLEERFWPAACHVIGKDILWFHTVIWPAMLLSAELPLPEQVYVHGFVLDKDGRKMSKHLDNVVDPLEVVHDYSVDILRFYLLKALSSSQDGNFSVGDLDDRYHSELGNDLGNLVMRISKLVRSRAGGSVEPPGKPTDIDAGKLEEEFLRHVDRREHHRAMDRLWAQIREINAYLNDKSPWKVKDSEEVAHILYSCVDALRVVVHLLSPAMPATSASIARTLGFDLVALEDITPATLTYRVAEAKALFPRRETRDDRIGASKKNGNQAKKGASRTPQPSKDPYAKLEIRVGRIVEVREHPDADKLFAMTVEIGGEQRSICAGLREYLKVEDLEDRKVVVLANLKPAVMRGIESRGMILASDRKDGKVVPVDPGEAASGDLVAVEGIETQPKKKLSRSDFEKAPLEVRGGRVTYGGKPLRTPAGEILCDAEDGAAVR